MIKKAYPLLIIFMFSLALTIQVPAAHSVVYYGKDLDTKGDWIGKYGTAGYILCAYDSGYENRDEEWRKEWDRASLPFYVSDYSVEGTDDSHPAGVWEVAAHSSDPRFLMDPDVLDPNDKNNTHWYTTPYCSDQAVLTVHLSITTCQKVYLSLYFLDSDQRRTLTVQLTDSDNITDVIELSNSDTSNGVYTRFFVHGPTELTIKLKMGNCNPCISGIFFDPFPGQIPPIPEVPLGTITTLIATFSSLILKKKLYR